MSLYDTLGVNQDATRAEIKAAYRKLAQKLHPDKTDNEADHERFAAVKHAYEVLSDEARRKQYDETGATDISDEERTRRDAFLVLIAQALDVALAKTISPLKAARDICDSAVRDLTAQRKELMKMSRKIEAMVGKSKRKGEGTDWFAHLIDDRLTKTREAAEQTLESLTEAEELRDMLKDYDFDLPENLPAPPGFRWRRWDGRTIDEIGIRRNF